MLDIVGAKYLAANVGVLRPNGRLVVIGLQGGVKGELDLGALLAKRGTLAATSLRARPVEEKGAARRGGRRAARHGRRRARRQDPAQLLVKTRS